MSRKITDMTTLITVMMLTTTLTATENDKFIFSMAKVEGEENLRHGGGGRSYKEFCVIVYTLIISKTPTQEKSFLHLRCGIPLRLLSLVYNFISSYS